VESYHLIRMVCDSCVLIIIAEILHIHELRVSRCDQNTPEMIYSEVSELLLSGIPNMSY